MSKENNLKLNGKFAIEKCEDKNYKKVAYSYSYKDTNLKYFVYVPTVNGKDEKYYIAAATKDVEEANNSGKLRKYSRKYYGDVRHHTRKVAIVTTICVVAAGALLFSGHCAYKMVNGWKEMSADEFKTYAEALDAKQLVMTMPVSGKTSLPVSSEIEIYHSPFVNVSSSLPEYPITNVYYDAAHAYIEYETYPTVYTYDESGEPTGSYEAKQRVIYAAMKDERSSQEGGDPEKMIIYVADYLYNLDDSKEVYKDRHVYNDRSGKIKQYETYEEANKDLIKIVPDGYKEDETFEVLLRKNASGSQIYKKDGIMQAAYASLEAMKSSITGKADASIKYYKKNAAGSLSITVSFDVDGKLKYTPEGEKEAVEIGLKGSGKFEVTLENYLLHDFNVDYKVVVEDYEDEPAELHRDYTCSYNNDDIYREDWKTWDIKK